MVSAHLRVYDAAKKAGVNLKIEACVRASLGWREFRKFVVTRFLRSGIMNATTNFIIIPCSNGTDFAEVLSRLRAGLRRARPVGDIDGIDVRSKTMISASTAFDVICTDKIPMSGIKQLSAILPCLAVTI